MCGFDEDWCKTRIFFIVGWFARTRFIKTQKYVLADKLHLYLQKGGESIFLFFFSPLYVMHQIDEEFMEYIDQNHRPLFKISFITSQRR